MLFYQTYKFWETSVKIIQTSVKMCDFDIDVIAFIRVIATLIPGD